MAAPDFEVDCSLTEGWLFSMGPESEEDERLLAMTGRVTLARGRRRQAHLQTAVLMFLTEWLSWVCEMLGGNREACHLLPAWTR